jgi:hypothetical protein
MAPLLADGWLPVWVVIPFSAFFASLLHELEHDLIHVLYFRTRPWVQHVMFVGIWLFKASLNPWARKDLHLLHHKVSGQTNDSKAKHASQKCARSFNSPLPLSPRSRGATDRPRSAPAPPATTHRVPASLGTCSRSGHRSGLQPQVVIPAGTSTLPTPLAVPYRPRVRSCSLVGATAWVALRRRLGTSVLRWHRVAQHAASWLHCADVVILSLLW